MILRPDETIIELNNGCLCCTLNDNLYDILNDLHDRRDEFDEVIIEATGIADPTGLAQPFIIHPLIKKHFPLKRIICLVDAELIEDQLEDTEEAINQIAYSDVLLINKIDLVSEDYLPELESKLSKLNPLATIIKGQKDHFPNIESMPKNDRLEKLLEPMHKAEHVDNPSSFPVQKPHRHHHHNHTEEVFSHSFTLSIPFNDQVLRQQFLIYLSFQSKGLYRIKGLLWLENEDHQYVLQSVGSRMSIEPKRLWSDTEQKQSVIVFIGKNLQRVGLEKLINRCLSRFYSKRN